MPAFPVFPPIRRGIVTREHRECVCAFHRLAWETEKLYTQQSQELLNVYLESSVAGEATLGPGEPGTHVLRILLIESLLLWHLEMHLDAVCRWPGIPAKDV